MNKIPQTYSFDACWRLLGLLLVSGMVCTGCADVPFLKKAPLQESMAESSYEPPPQPLPDPEPKAQPIIRPTSNPGSSNPIDARLAELASQFEVIRTRVQVLEGKLAEQEHQLNQLIKSGNPQQAQMQEKLSGLERELAATQERLAQVEGQRPPQAVAAVPVVMSGNREAGEAAPTAKKAPPAAPAKVGSDPFAEGLTLYKQKSYGPAREKFQRYLEEHPKGEKAVEARYYLADSLYQEKHHDEAIVEFNKVLEGYPKSTLAPASLLKQAYAFKAQGKSKVHNLILEKLIADYPQSPEAAQARKLRGSGAAASDKKKGK
ncbi:tetratricopeptide repeat protein [Desulfobacca acetoxidans]